MITPNKVVPYQESALAHLATIIDRIQIKRSLADLLRDVEGSFESIDQFLLAIDVLYVLGRINVDFGTGEISLAS